MGRSTPRTIGSIPWPWTEQSRRRQASDCESWTDRWATATIASRPEHDLGHRGQSPGRQRRRDGRRRLCSAVRRPSAGELRVGRTRQRHPGDRHPAGHDRRPGRQRPLAQPAWPWESYHNLGPRLLEFHGVGRGRGVGVGRSLPAERRDNRHYVARRRWGLSFGRVLWRSQ